MARRIDVFYAFPANPPEIKETIEGALGALKLTRDVQEKNIRFKPWPAMAGAGRPLVRTVADNIDRAELFACDLTYLNSNVIFELGYAVGRFKRVWVSLNNLVEDSTKNYNRVLYTTSGGLLFAPYANRQELAHEFITAAPWRDLTATPLGKEFRNKAPLEEYPTLLYLKPPADTDAVVGAGEALAASGFGEAVIIDDPRENPSPTLEWYATKVRSADAVLVQFLPDNYRGASEHKARSSFVAGLAYALGKPLLLVAGSPFEAPMDYQTLLVVHETARHCVDSVKRWVADVENGLPRRRARRSRELVAKAGVLDLRRLSVGELRAEHERRTLDSYFVETSAYYRALESSSTIVVGRRGTGKTAILFAMQDEISKDKRDHVCVIKPVGYEIDGLVRVLEEIRERSERGYLVESLWKFLIFSELAASVFNEIAARPLLSQLDTFEKALFDYVNANRNTLLAPFSERLEGCVRSLSGIGDLHDALRQRARISELLHAGTLNQLRLLLGDVLSTRKKVAILVDNLDEPWGPGGNIQSLSELLNGLIRVAGEIPEQFGHHDSRRKRVNLTITVFIRSDIFAFVQPLATEEDKLPIQRVVWDDPELLLKLVYQRLEYAAPAGLEGKEIWARVFPDKVVGVSAWEFITRTVLQKPRDVIYIVRAAVDGAVNRGHPTVTAEDMLAARRAYSEFAFNSIKAEDDPRKGKLEAVLYEFGGAPRTVTYDAICERIVRAGAASEDCEFYVDLLCDVNFLGVEGAQGFRYCRDEGERRTTRRVARSLAREHGRDQELFEINAVFHEVLQIE